MTWSFDSHIHLSDPQYAPDMDFILQEMSSLKIKSLLCIYGCTKFSRDFGALQKSDLVLPFIGIHPECANDELEKVVTMIEDNHDIISGVGEIGLDPTYTNNDEDTKRQTLVFETLLSCAEKFHKPVSIHSRKSLDDVFQVMTSYDTKHALLHWFDGSKKQLAKAMDMGFYVSFGPVMVYANDKQTLLSKCDESKVLVETDGPVRFSRCFEMKSADIGFIPSVIFCASKILGKSFDETALLLEKNSNSYLGI